MRVLLFFQQVKFAHNSELVKAVGVFLKHLLDLLYVRVHDLLLVLINVLESLLKQVSHLLLRRHRATLQKSVVSHGFGVAQLWNLIEHDCPVAEMVLLFLTAFTKRKLRSSQLVDLSHEFAVFL